MAIQLIDLGASANNGLGDKLRIGGDKINDNFTEVYDKLVSDNFVVVKTLADFPTPVANVITLADNTTYFITAEIDTLGNRFILGNGTAIKGSSVINSKLYTSLAIAGFNHMFTSNFSVDISDIKIDTGIYGTILFDGDETIDNVNLINIYFENCSNLGGIENYKNVNILNCNLKNSGDLFFDSIIANTHISNCVFYVITQGITIGNTAVISNQFKISNSYLYATGTDFVIEASGSATISSNGYVLENNTFTGGSTTYIAGLSHTSSKSYFKNNIGIRNTSDTGFARYLDGTYTSGSPLTVNSGVTATFTNNAVNTLSTQMPSDMTMMFNPATQKIIAKNDGDVYLLSIRFKAKINIINGYFDIKLDIGGTQGIISQESIVFTRDANTEQTFDVDLTLFSGSTFVANGGTLQINPKNGNMQVYDISFVLVRTHKAQ